MPLPLEISNGPEAKIYEYLYKPENLVHETNYEGGGNVVLKIEKTLSSIEEGKKIFTIISKWYGDITQEDLIESVNKVAEAGKNNRYFLILDLRTVTKLPFSLSSEVTDLAMKVLTKENLKFILIPGNAMHNLIASLLSQVFKSRYSKQDTLQQAFDEIDSLIPAIKMEEVSL